MAEEDPLVDARRQAMIDDDTILRDALCHGIVGDSAGALCGRESEFVVDSVPVCAGHLTEPSAPGSTAGKTFRSSSHPRLQRPAARHSRAVATRRRITGG